MHIMRSRWELAAPDGVHRPDETFLGFEQNTVAVGG
jgi:hypothetical protein